MFNKNKVIVFLYSLLAFILIFSIYFKRATQEKYFPYRDTYAYKLIEYKTLNKIGRLPNDPLFFYNQAIFQKITGIDYYYIYKYGYLFFLFLLFLGIYIFFRGVIKDKQLQLESNKYIPISIIYIFMFFFMYIRNTMTMRENLVVFVGLVFLFVLAKYEDFFKYRKISLLLLLLYVYCLQGHVLVGLITSGVLFLYFVFNLFKSSEKIHYLFRILLFYLSTIILSLGSIRLIVGGIINQMNRGLKPMKAGFTFGQTQIEFTDFRHWDIFLILPLGIFLFIKYRKKINKVMLLYLATLAIAYFTSFIKRFEVKQNRYLIYFYILFGFLFVLNSFNLKKHKQYILPIFVALIILSGIQQNIVEYQGYFPLNERNISFVQELLDHNLLDIEDTIYCSTSACLALNYLYTSSFQNREQIDKIDITSLNPARDQIVIFDDDWWQYNKKDRSDLMSFIKNNKNNIFLDPLLQERFEIWEY